MAIEGAIAERARGELPITWDALLNDARFGDGLLQPLIDEVKERLFGEVVAPAEEDEYPLTVIKYAGKLIALELITPGVDFWMNQPSQTTATGTNETDAYVNRAAELQATRARLLIETRQMATDAAALIRDLTGFYRLSSRVMPRVSTQADELLTPNPQDFPRPYAEPTV